MKNLLDTGHSIYIKFWNYYINNDNYSILIANFPTNRHSIKLWLSVLKESCTITRLEKQVLWGLKYHHHDILILNSTTLIQFRMYSNIA